VGPDDRALDIWKTFLWEWTTERALPFETSYKHKSTSHVADTLLFERAAGTGVKVNPESVMAGAFEEFTQRAESAGFHLGQCAVRWLEQLFISEQATYLTVPWGKEFLDIVMAVAITYYDALRDRCRAPFRQGSFFPSEPVGEADLEFVQGMFEVYVHDLFLRAFDRANVVGGPSLSAAKGVVVQDNFERARDRVAQWRFIVSDLFTSTVVSPVLQLRYPHLQRF
jgi:hypothetical protein